jgi:hypothetical protein
LDGLGNATQKVDKLDLGKVQGLDLQMGDDFGLESLERLLLGISHGHPGLLLAAQGLKLTIKLGQKPGGVRVFLDGGTGVFISGDGGVLGDNVTQFARLVHDLLCVYGHAVPC